MHIVTVTQKPEDQYVHILEIIVIDMELVYAEKLKLHIEDAESSCRAAATETSVQ